MKHWLLFTFIFLGSLNVHGARNPFSPLPTLPEKKEIDKEITDYYLYELRLKAIAWSPDKAVALLEGNDGRTYLVKPGSKVGKKGGKVSKIDAKMMVVEEPLGKKVFELKGNE